MACLCTGCATARLADVKGEDGTRWTLEAHGKQTWGVSEPLYNSVNHSLQRLTDRHFLLCRQKLSHYLYTWLKWFSSVRQAVLTTASWHSNLIQLFHCSKDKCCLQQKETEANVHFQVSANHRHFLQMMFWELEKQISPSAVKETIKQPLKHPGSTITWRQRDSIEWNRR